MVCTSSPAKLPVPEAVGEGVTKIEAVKGGVAASTLMVGVEKEDGRGVGVAALDLMPMDGVAEVEIDPVDAKDGVCDAVGEKGAVGIAGNVAL